MNAKACYPVSFLTGAIISVMVTFNTVLGEASTNEVSITVNQITGIIALSAVMFLFHKNKDVNPPRSHAPWYLWGGGLFGLVGSTCNYFSVRGAGPPSAMASAVFGQCLAGMLFDITGLMGMQKRHVSWKKAGGIALSFAGIIIMLAFSGTPIDPLYAVIGTAAGIITMFQMVYNSHLAKLKGAFFSARQNVISGLIGITLFSFIAMPEETLRGFSALSSVSFPLIIGGGVLACFVVVLSNTVIPRIPAADSSVLMSSGQVLTAALIDIILYGAFHPSLITGSIVMLLGIMLTRQS